MEEADITAQKVRRAQKPQLSAYMGLGLVLKVPQGSFPQLLHQVMVVMLLSFPALPSLAATNIFWPYVWYSLC